MMVREPSILRGTLLLALVGALAGPAGVVFAGPPGEEEVWSIRCITLQAADRAALAKRYAEALKRAPGLKAKLVEVVEDADGTAVFYGRYQREYSATGEGQAFKPDPRHELEAIRNLAMKVQVEGQAKDAWPFYLATMDLLPTYKPQHPEWSLDRADGYWVLHVGVFFNTSEFRNRRSAAEQYCAMLREKGEPAWYHHAAVNSSVYIGPYPRDAVVEMRSENPLANKVTTKFQIVDARMIAAQQRYPVSLQNGGTIYDVIRDRYGAVKDRIPIPSFPCVVPKAEQQEQKTEAKKPADTHQKPPGW